MAHVVSAYSRNTTRIVIDARKRDLDGKAGRTLVAQEPIVSTVLPTVCGWLFVTMRESAVLMQFLILFASFIQFLKRRFTCDAT